MKSVSSNPFYKKRFFLDIIGCPPEVEKNLLIDLKWLGAKEAFHCKDATFVVSNKSTQCKPWVPTTLNSPSHSPQMLSDNSMDLGSPEYTSPHVVERKAVPLSQSRGKVLLQKSQQIVKKHGTTDTLAVCKQYGVKVYHIDKVLSYLKKIKNLYGTKKVSNNQWSIGHGPPNFNSYHHKIIIGGSLDQHSVVEGMRGPKKEFHIFFVPRKSELCQEKLSERGVCANIIEYTAELFPVDSDVLSMEWETSFKHVFDLMTRMRRELSGNDPQITPQIDCLLLLDRSVDLVSVLATQLTYEGLLDENFGINNNTIELPPEKFCKGGEGGLQEIPTEPKRLLLNSGEELFAELRDKNFNAVGPTLSKKAKVLSAQFDERHGAKTIDAIKQFVDKLPHMQAAKKSLATHTSMAELIKEVIDSEMFLNSLQTEQEFMNGLDTDKTNAHIEDCIAREEPFIKVLRLICLQSLTNNGLKPKQLDYYKREIIQTYGYQQCLTLNNLEKAELLKVQGNRTYSVIRKTLRLIVDDVNEQSPSDISYVHSGYAPLSVRLAQFLTQPGWRAIPDVLNILPGPTIEGVQKIPLGLRKRRGSGSSIQSSTEEQKVTLVFFLGGCTFAEISALRFLSQQDDSPIEYIIATTKLLNGRTFLENLQEVVKVPAG